MYKLDEKKADIFINACRQVASYGLVTCSAGNLSWRLDEQLMVITATGSWLGEISAEDIAVCQIADGTSINGKKPSKEICFHQGIMIQKQDVNVVLHCHSPYATALACGNHFNYDFNILGEIPYFIGNVKVLDNYLMPGSAELAQAVLEAVKNSGLVLLCNHGQITFGRDFKEALQKAAFFEQVCQIILSQPAVRPIPTNIVKKIRDLSKSANRKL